MIAIKNVLLGCFKGLLFYDVYACSFECKCKCYKNKFLSFAARVVYTFLK